MAATKFSAVVFAVLFVLLDGKSSLNTLLVEIESGQHQSSAFSCANLLYARDYGLLRGKFKLQLISTGFHKSRRPVSKGSKHGFTVLTIPGHEPPLDVTIYVDVAINPGPNGLTAGTNTSICLQDHRTGTEQNLHISPVPTCRITYTRNELLAIRYANRHPIGTDTIVLKEYGLFKYRGKRAGRKRIPVRITNRGYQQQLAITDYANPVRDRTFVDIPIVLERSEVNQNNLKFCVWNAQSIRNKSASFSDYICDQNIDLIALTETWFTDNDSAVKLECTPDGYKIFDYSRSGRTGGGIALVCHSDFIVKKISYCERSSFEMSEWILKGEQSSRLRLSVIYRPPYSAKHPVTTGAFISEFAEYLESFVLCTEPVLVCGDFNIHVDNPADPDGMAFCALLASMGLKQHVTSPTQIHGHTLDLIISRQTDSLIVDTPIADSFLSDHATVICHLNMAKVDLAVKTVSYRKTQSIDLDAFKADICASSLLRQDTPTTLDTLVNYYNTTMKSLLEKHAPLRTKTVVARVRVPWFNDEIRSAKRLRRRAERKWRTTGLESDFREFKSIKNKTTYLMNKARCAFYTNFIDENSYDQRKLFSATSKLLHLGDETLFPPHSDKAVLADDMGSFFVKKISDIRSDLDSMPCLATNPGDTTDPCPTSFRQFELLDENSVRTLVMSAATKSCSLDPVPTTIVKDCLDELLPVLTAMINMSLQTGEFTDAWKEALINPLLKRSGLDLIFKNFRPVSNLQFTSKLVERAATNQTYSYMIDNGFLPVLQSAYRPGHSTETALLKVKNDILLNMDKQHITLLVLLDLSAAFDTVDHQILLSRLHMDFGISGTALHWFKSYISNRSQRVSVDGVLSKRLGLDFGVPQGSCLGPLLFVIYSSKLFTIIKAHLPQVHCYADDTQLYLSFKAGDTTDEAAVLSAMESCIMDIQNWMLTDKLKLNADKTDFLLIGTRKQLEKVTLAQVVNVGCSSVKPSTGAVKNLGAWFDQNLNMLHHINKICSSSFYHLHNIRRIRKYLSCQTTKLLVHAFITSKLDYCNSLLYGLPKSHIAKLQRVQNSAARLVMNLPRFCHITPVLTDLHWLPVVYRIQFKILIITFKCLYGLAPSYLSELVNIRSTRIGYNLRSVTSLLLVPASSKLKITLGDCSFKAAAPKLWNKLPSVLRNLTNLSAFKSQLKTHLFKLAFEL